MASAAGQVEINTASLEQLDELTGVGPAIAQRIVYSRPYVSVDDLLRVKGIGEKTLQKIKDQGLAYVSGETQQPVATPAAPTPTPEPEITYPGGIFINELLPSPEGADETNEFIEVYNSNDLEVDLTGWKLQDAQGTAGNYIFPAAASIAAGGYLALKRPETKILLNNDQDSVSLLFPNGNIADKVSFTGAPAKHSYSKTSTGWNWSIAPTAGQKNIITTVIKALPKAKKTDKKANKALVLANGQPITIDKAAFAADLKKDGASPWLLFIIAAAITMVSGAAFLAAKLILFKKQNT